MASTAGKASGGKPKRNISGPLSIVVIVAASLLLAATLLSLFVAGRQNPQVSVQPDNCYTETLHVVAQSDYAPYSFLESDGRQSGYCIELATILANRVGMNLDVQLADRVESVRMVHDGEAQAVLPCESNVAASNYDTRLVCTVPTVHDEYVAFATAAAAATATTTLSNLYGKKIAVVEEGISKDVLDRLGLLENCLFCSDNRSALQVVADGDADYAVMRYEVGNYLVEDMGLGLQGVVSIGSGNISIGVDSGRVDLAHSLNEALFDMMEDGTVAQLNEKWIEGFTAPQAFSSTLLESKLLKIAIISACLLVIVLAIMFRRDRKSKRELKAVKAQLCELKKQTSRSSRSRIYFFSYIAHDIRTHINSIIGNVDRINRYRSDVDKVADCLGKVEACSYQLLSILNDAVDAERLAEGTLVLSRGSFDILALFAKIEQTCSRVSASYSLKLNVKMGKIVHRNVVGDEERIRQSISSISKMIFEYIPDRNEVDIIFGEVEGTGTRSVFRCTIECAEADVEPDALAHIWEIRHSKDETRTRAEYNLAAAVSKSVVELMDGSVIVKTGKNGSVSCIIDIPLDIDMTKFDDATNQEEVDLSAMRVLVVDDNEMNLDITQDILIDEGLSVQAASSGKEALELFERSPIGYFDAVIMDVVMPEMDGLEATRRIRGMARSDAATMPIIVLSASAQEDDVRLAHEAGVNAFLAKPLDAAQLIQFLANYAKHDEQR